MHVWVIMAECGEYDSFSTWVDSVWSSKEAAEQEKIRLETIQADLAVEKIKTGDHAYWVREGRVFYGDALELSVDSPGGELETE